MAGAPRDNARAAVTPGGLEGYSGAEAFEYCLLGSARSHGIADDRHGNAECRDCGTEIVVRHMPGREDEGSDLRLFDDLAIEGVAEVDDAIIESTHAYVGEYLLQSFWRAPRVG